ncbi:hypothetical protein A3H21_00480 [Candidatus Woesebacteria bacterium RIFCSPLOWO2_12_FULL_42_8]|nr:MAG: hypothetical protein A3H21_00480 [Candidatus Woesebacteria bacterium RIFCSPLOWO2_12_FULL_42_8]
MKTEYAIGILRVSSTKQGLMGDSHEDQKQQLLRRAEQLGSTINRKITIEKFFEFTESASGELDGQPILKALDYCKNPHNKVSYAFIKSIDRGTRGGATMYGLLKSQFAKYGVQFIDVYGVIGTQTVNTLDHLGLKYGWSEFSPSFITELLEAERAKGEVRDILTRMIGAEVRYVRMGYRVRPAPPGYQNKKIETSHGMRVILAPHPVESPWFIKMFELREQGTLTDLQIVEQVNAIGYKSRTRKLHDKTDKQKIIDKTGGIPLTIKQMQRYIQNPIYAGVNTEKWLDGEPTKCKFPGLVSIEIFNRANRGKITIVEDGDVVKIYRGKVDPWRLRKQKENPLYPYKQYILCPACRNQLLASASKGKSGKHFPAYHCSRGHKYFRIPVDALETCVEAFMEHVDFDESFVKRFRDIFLGEWNKREHQVSDVTVKLNERLISIEHEIHELKDKIKILSLPTTIKLMEEDIEKLELEKTNIVGVREKKEKEQIDIQILINYTQYFMEHLKDLLFGSTNPFQNAAMFGLVFEDLPTYAELENGTLNLAPIFKLNDAYKTSKSLSVNVFEQIRTYFKGSGG